MLVTNYGHKILTGRRDSFQQTEKQHGISGFPKVKVAKARYFRFGTLPHLHWHIVASETDRQHIAVTMTSNDCGLAFSFMNHAGVKATLSLS
jgi:1-deoxy-D-xylulose-5-phosphate synthase